MTAFALPDRLTIVDASPAGRDEPHVRALVDAARGGDREAFGDLVARYERVVFRTSLAALGDRADAGDAAQEAFVMAWQKLPGFRGDSTFRTWLLTIVWRKALDRRRVRTLWWTRTRSHGTDEDEHLIDAVPALAATPEQHAVSRDLARRVRGEIARLSPKLRDALLLASSGEQSYEEIAGILRIPVGTLKWRVSEARRILQRRIAW